MMSSDRLPHQQVRDGQVDEQKVDPTFALAVPSNQDVEHGQIGHGADEEEGAVAHDGYDVGRVEAHVAGQLWICV